MSKPWSSVRLLRWLVLVVTAVVGGTVVSAEVEPLALYVSIRGDDAAGGRTARLGQPDGPFATLGRAQTELRRLKAAGQLPDGAVVYCDAGDYYLDAPWTLGPEDSGTAQAGIVYRGAGGQETRIVGGRALSDFRPYRGKVVQCDLKSAGLSGHRFGQLFFRGKRQVLARYPNLDPSDPHGGGWAHVAKVEGNENHKEFFYGSDEEHAWAHPEDARVPIFAGYDWAFSVLPIAEHLPEARKIVVRGSTWGPLRIGDRYAIEGLLEELDTAGEWYRDPRTETLYFWPPEPIAAGDVVVPVADNLLVLDGANHVTVRGFLFDVSEKTGIEVKNCRGSLVAGNLVRNCGGTGIAISGGQQCGAQSNEVGWCGQGGISIQGGDGKTLAPGGNFAENNYVHHTARIWKTYRPAIAIGGVGNRISHNLIHDVPHAGVTLSGNDNVMEYNVVHHVNLESGDTGGIYFCSRDWSQRGNVIRHNIFHHIGGFGKSNSWVPVRDGKVEFGYPHFTWGIYLDDPTTGTHVFGNILYQVPICGLHNHGGRDNLWENNVIVDCPAFQAGRLSPSWSEWPAIYKKLEAVRHEGSPYLQKYPELAEIADTRPEAMSGVRFQRNIVYLTKQGTEWLRHERAADWGGENRQLLYTIHIDAEEFDPANYDFNCVWREQGLEPVVKLSVSPEPTVRLNWDEWRQRGSDAHSILADPKFVDPANHDYRLEPDSPALALGFKPIPVEKIGPYRDEYRSVWPITEAPGVASRGDFVTRRYYEPPQYRPVAAVPSALRDGLGNFMAKVVAKRPVKVVYFGGGIHPPGGWRKPVMDWLRQQGVEVDAVDAGISDAVRGSAFSVYRFEHDVLRHKPDLVLVDFASADQAASPDVVERSIEGIVRQAWEADPSLDLLFLYAFRSGGEAFFDRGVCPPSVSAYERIAEHYGIPSIDMGYRVAELRRAGKLLIQADPQAADGPEKSIFSGDGVRPSADGDRVYAAAIIEALQPALSRADAAPHALGEPYNADHSGRARQVPIAESMLSGPWKRLPADDPLAKSLARHFDTIWHTDAPGAVLSFRFKGTSAAIFDLMGPDTGRVRVTVDGREVGVRQQVDPWAYYQRLASLNLAENLDDREHAVSVELLPEPPDRAVAIDGARKAGRYVEQEFQGVALRFAFIRIVGEPIP